MPYEQRPKELKDKTRPHRDMGQYPRWRELRGGKNLASPGKDGKISL